MPEPNEPLAGLITPNTGDLTGAWGTAALNANFVAIGGMAGGVLNLSFSGATTITLTGPSGSITPGAGPTQQQNFMLNFSGAQTGNAVLFFSRPGTYAVNNRCTGTTAYVQCAPASGTGTYIGIPQGKATQIYFDGTNVDFLNPLDAGVAYDLHGAVAIPPWMQACKVQPYLPKDGTVYNVSSYTALAQVLGSTFGGNGVTTFGVPDERNRMRMAWDNSGTSGRVTAAGSGINGVAMGAAGGDQLMQSHQHTAATINLGTLSANEGQFIRAIGGGTPSGAGGLADDAPGATPTITIPAFTPTIATTGSGGSQNLPPTIVSFLALIKT
jgi:microcystin-dependent protein